MAPLASAFITSFGNLSDLASEIASPFFVNSSALIFVAIGFDYLYGVINPDKWLYLGTVMGLIIELCAASYIIVKTNNAVVSFTQGFSFNYRGGSILGNQIGLYELTFVFLYYATALGLTGMAIFGASEFWNLLDERNIGVKTLGFAGNAISWNNAVKFFVIGAIVVTTTYYGAYGIGETVDNLIGWFDDWDDKENSEATGSITPGTSFSYDLTYHSVTVVMTWFLYTFIIVGAHLFAQRFIQLPELEGCDLEGLDKSHYSEVGSLLAAQVDMASCKASVKQIFRIADLNSNGHISRCESASFMYAIGNTQKFALNYNQEEALSLLYAQLCYSRFTEE